MPAKDPIICAIGDVHGHLQLGLCVAARRQRELGVSFDAVLLCGDVGSFTDDAQLDNATRRHGRRNPCELEFLHQWAADPQPEWLQAIFQPSSSGGLGLLCPVVMVHGNHEGFDHLRSLLPGGPAATDADMRDLPAVDSGGHIRWLPSGWKARTPSGLIVAGAGGIEKGQREADYDELAYIDEGATLDLGLGGRVDVLVTHQGPSSIQGESVGSRALDDLLEEEIARIWFHGHSVAHPEIRRGGPRPGTLVVPLHDIAFAGRGPKARDPGEDGWCWARLGEEITVERERPAFWRKYRSHLWRRTAGGGLICPDLVGAIPRGA
ncbi:MAG: metallophosphoesterase [Planctomycetota bacterium]